jgi:hypothetical protein
LAHVSGADCPSAELAEQVHKVTRNFLTQRFIIDCAQSLSEVGCRGRRLRLWRSRG